MNTKSQSFKSISLMLVLSMIIGAVLVPYRPALAASDVVFAPSNSASPMSSSVIDPVGQQFASTIVQFNYGTGAVCISADRLSCTKIQIDDSIEVLANGQFVTKVDSFTNPINPIYIPSNFLQTNTVNRVEVHLIDKIGPLRGNGPLYLVYAGPADTTCSISSVDIAQKELYVPNPVPDYHVGTLFRHSGSFRSCPNFSVNASYTFPSGENGVSINGSSGNTTMSATIDSKGNVAVGASFPSPSNITKPVENPGDGITYDFEVGVENNYTVGSTTLGVWGEYKQQVLARFKKRQMPEPNVKYDLAHFIAAHPNFTARQDASLVLGGMTLVTAVSIILGGVTFVLNPAQRVVTLLGLPGFMDYKLPTTPTVVASTVDSSETAASVSDPTLVAVRKDIPSLVSYLTLNPITSRDKVSAFTKFSYTASGFTPNGVVYVTFGIPGSDDMFWQFIEADGIGNIQGTIEMPAIAQTPYGQYLLTAFDYATVQNSLDRVFADPANGVLRVYAAAKLIDVVADTTAPVTTASATGPLDTNKIFRDSVSIKLDATDDLSGVAYGEYSLDGGSSWKRLEVGQSFAISGNGMTQFLYRSVDKYGNVETAKDSGPIIINKYVVFANGTDTSLLFTSNTKVTVTGNTHTNGSLQASGNIYLTLNGQLTRVGAAALSGNIGGSINSVPSSAVAMLSYPMSMFEKAAIKVINGDLTINSASSSLSGLYFVKGNITINSANVVGNTTLVATGNILDYSAASSFVNSDPKNGVVYYAGGNIEVRSAKNTYFGMMYAPNGKVYINGAASGTHTGSFVGKTVEFARGNTLNIVYNAAFTNGTYQLPLTPPLWVASAAATEPVVSEEQSVMTSLYLPMIYK